MTQAQRLIGYFGGATGSEWANGPGTPSPRMPTGCASGASQQPHQVSQAAGDHLRPYGGRAAALAPADTAMIVAALDRTEARVVRIVHAGVSGRAAKWFRGRRAAFRG